MSSMSSLVKNHETQKSEDSACTQNEEQVEVNVTQQAIYAWMK